MIGWWKRKRLQRRHLQAVAERTTFVIVNDLGWHVISGERLLEMFRRAAAGENPDLLYAEEWANAEHHHEESAS